MTEDSKLNLDEDARKRLVQCYAVLIRLADERATDPETVDEEPRSVAQDGAEEAPSQQGP